MRQRALVMAMVLAAAVVGDIPPAGATPSPDQKLQRVEEDLAAGKTRQEELDKAMQSLEEELADLRTRVIAAADEAARQDGTLAELEAQLQATEADESALARRLASQRQQIAELLGALQRLSRLPPETLMARPEGPVETVRSALLLASAVPALRDRAQALAEDLSHLAETRSRLVGERERVASAGSVLEAQQREVARLVARREQLSRLTENERAQITQRMTRLTAQAADLRQLMDRVESDRKEVERRKTEEDRRRTDRKETDRKEIERKEAERKETDRPAETPVVLTVPAAPTEALGSGFRLPVAGRVMTRFGEADRFGATSRGLTIATRTGMPVVAPSAGKIMFAGPFRGYGQILIVEHSNGYHSLIAGLGRIDTAVGKQVAAGEPVGVIEAPAAGPPDLYFELRRNGQPINPQRGAGGSAGKGQG